MNVALGILELLLKGILHDGLLLFREHLSHPLQQLHTYRLFLLQAQVHAKSVHAN